MLSHSYIRPVEEALRSGTLQMGADPGVAAVQTSWSDSPLNAALLVLFALLMIVNLRNFLDILPSLVDCIFRWKANLNLEDNIHLGLSRNYSALIAFIPFCLLSDRLGLFKLKLFNFLPEGFSVIGVIAVVLAYAILRRLIYAFLSIRARRPDTFRAVHFSSFNYFIIATLLLIVVALILLLFRCPDHAAKVVGICTVGVVYLLSFVRKKQIFSSFCAPIQTILYLCALEVLPTGLLIAAVILL